MSCVPRDRVPVETAEARITARRMSMEMRAAASKPHTTNVAVSMADSNPIADFSSVRIACGGRRIEIAAREDGADPDYDRPPSEGSDAPSSAPPPRAANHSGVAVPSGPVKRPTQQVGVKGPAKHRGV